MSTSPARPSADARLQDYLNDKFQTLADLSTLDTLLTSVQTQQDQLRSQLTTAESTLTSAQEALNTHQVKLQTARTSFDSRQSNITRRLQATTSAPTAAEAASHLSTSLEKLRRLDVASSYIFLLQTVQSLTDETRAHINLADPRAALEPYSKLQQLSKGLRERDEAQDGVVVHLVDYVEKSEKGLWEEMKTPLVKAVDEVLKRIGWPKEGVTMDKETQSEFTEGFEKLLVLQMGGMEDGEGGPLIAMEVLARSLGVRFRALFEGERATNKIDKPEWFLSHLSSLVGTYEDFLDTYIQPIFTSSPDPRLSTRTATTEFITALLPLLRRKLTTILPHIRHEPSLLSHLIHELIRFDAELREEWGYAPHGSRGVWKGMTHEILVEQGGFEDWLRVEKEFALARYEEIVSSPDAFKLSPPAHPPSHPIPTPSAHQLAALSTSITSTYRPLISFSHRLRFLLDLTLTLLDRYHARLSSSLEAFRVLSSTLARAVQGTSREELDSLQGLGGLERLCRVYCSAWAVEEWMRDAGEDLFFLELWEDLSSRASKSRLPGELNLQAVASATSTAVLEGEEDGALFDETRTSYRKLRERTLELVTETTTAQALGQLRAYGKITLWSTTSEMDEFAPSLEILGPVATLREHVSFLLRTLSPLPARRIFRAVSASLEGFFINNVIMRNQFSLSGALQLRGDVEELWRAATAAGVQTGDRDEGEVLPRKLRDTVKLLTLETEELRGKVGEIFADNGKAKAWLEGKGLGGLGVGEARGVVQRRVEAWA